MVENATTHNTQIVRDDDNEGTTMAVFRNTAAWKGAPLRTVSSLSAAATPFRLSLGKTAPCLA